MAFRQTILAGEELVRSGMRSPNYVEGVAGWRFGRDGDLEANTGRFRGAVLLGTVDGAQGSLSAADGLQLPAFSATGGQTEESTVSWVRADDTLSGEIGSGDILFLGPTLVMTTEGFAWIVAGMLLAQIGAQTLQLDDASGLTLNGLPVHSIQTDTFTFATNGDATFQLTEAVVFPTEFATAPAVLVSVASGPGAARNHYTIAHRNVDETGFDLVLNKLDTGVTANVDTTVRWSAFGVA